MTDAYERYWTPDLVAFFERFVDDLSNWYIRRSRRRFWNSDPAALQTLWTALTRSAVVIAPVMPFFAEHLWRALRSDDAPESVFLVRWQDAGERDEQLLAEVAATRGVVDLGRQARAASGLKLRQPLRRLVVEGAPLASGHVDEIRDELRVKEVELGEVEATELRVKPNLPVLGPKLGKELGAVRSALPGWRVRGACRRRLPGGRPRALGGRGARRANREGGLGRRGSRRGHRRARHGSTPSSLEGRVLDLIHELNSMRKEAGLELTDRIVVTLPEAASDLLTHADWIKEEVLAVEIRADGGSGTPEIVKA